MSSSVIKYSLMALALVAAAAPVGSGLLTTRQAKVDGVPQPVAKQDASNGISSSFAKLDHRHTLVPAPETLPPTCAAGEFVTSDGGGFLCKPEDDPKVGTLENGKLCTADLIDEEVGLVVTCVSDPTVNVINDAPPIKVTEEPLGDYVIGMEDCTESGSFLEYISPGLWMCSAAPAIQVELDPRLPHCARNQTLHYSSDAGDQPPVCVDEIPPAYGELYEEHLSTTVELTTQNAYYHWSTGTVGECYGMTCSAATDTLTITQAGVYRIIFEVSLSINAVNQVVESAIFAQSSGCDAGGCEIEKCTASQRLTTAGDEKSMTGACLLTLAAGDVLDLRFANYTSGGDTITIEHVSMSAANIGPTVAVGTFSGNYVASAATTAPLSGGAGPSQGAALSLSLALCANGEQYKMVDGGWACDPVPVGATPPPACTTGQFVTSDGGGFLCKDLPAATPPPLCTSGQFVTSDGGGFLCKDLPAATPPPLCTSGQFVTSDGGGFLCKDLPAATPPPLCTAGQFVTSDGGGFLCNDLPETAVYSGLPINGSGTFVSPVSLSSATCVAYASWRWNGASWACETELDPTVGDLAREIDVCGQGEGPVYDLANRRWECVFDLSQLNCAAGEAPIRTLSSPYWGCGTMPGLVGSCSAGETITWNGLYWECGAVASYRGTKTFDFSGGSSLACESIVVNVVGDIGAGDECIVGYDVAGPPPNARMTCWVDESDRVLMELCCTGACNPPSATYSVRVFTH